MKIYYVGKVLREDGKEWELQGIFDNKDEAIESVKESGCVNCFISSLDKNRMYPLETLDRADYGEIGFFPMLEDEK